MAHSNPAFRPRNVAEFRTQGGLDSETPHMYRTNRGFPIPGRPRFLFKNKHLIIDARRAGIGISIALQSAVAPGRRIVHNVTETR